ncbi:hypothetical protein C8J57DRAFT_1518792 [Mycena rebaudengoi]|nr:hypothetical protein C8J57DRAFT_1518792 [Mycena rebaudengoi]
MVHPWHQLTRFVATQIPIQQCLVELRTGRSFLECEYTELFQDHIAVAEPPVSHPNLRTREFCADSASSLAFLILPAPQRFEVSSRHTDMGMDMDKAVLVPFCPASPRICASSLSATNLKTLNITLNLTFFEVLLHAQQPLTVLDSTSNMVPADAPLFACAGIALPVIFQRICGEVNTLTDISTLRETG